MSNRRYEDRAERVREDERRMHTFFYKIIALAVSLVLAGALIIWLFLHYAC